MRYRRPVDAEEGTVVPESAGLGPKLSLAQTWATIISAPLAVIAMLITFLAWRHPQPTPVDKQPIDVRVVNGLPSAVHSNEARRVETGQAHQPVAPASEVQPAAAPQSAVEPGLDLISKTPQLLVQRKPHEQFKTVPSDEPTSTLRSNNRLTFSEVLSN